MSFFNRLPKLRFIGLGVLCVTAGLGLGVYNSGFWRVPTLDNFSAEKIVYQSTDTSESDSVTESTFTSESAGANLRLVNFWATWCAPCVHEMPILEAASQANASVYFSGWTLDHERDAVLAFLPKMDITYDIFIPKSDIFLYFEKSGNKNALLPYTVLLDEEGRLIAEKIGEFYSVEEVQAFIDQR